MKLFAAKWRDTASPIPGPTPTTARTGFFCGLRDMFGVEIIIYEDVEWQLYIYGGDGV